MSLHSPGIDYKPSNYKEHDFTEAPKFTTSLSDRATTVGYSTKLLCSVRGFPKVRQYEFISVSWLMAETFVYALK